MGIFHKRALQPKSQDPLIKLLVMVTLIDYSNVGLVTGESVLAEINYIV